MNNDKLQKRADGLIKSNASYVVILAVIAVLLLMANLPAYLLVFFAVFSFFVWKAFSPTHNTEIRGIFEFYLAANELLRDDDRRWFGFEMHEVLHAGEKIVNSMPDPPPLVLFTLGALYHKMGNNEAAAHYLGNVLENEELDEKKRLIASPELKNYVRILRKIERDPAEAPQTSAAIRALERARRNRASVMLEDSRKKLPPAKSPAEKGHFLDDDAPILDLTSAGVDSGTTNSNAWNEHREMRKDVSADLTENTAKPETPQPAKSGERQSISELLKDIYDR